jgi:hypothetical protein
MRVSMTQLSLAYDPRDTLRTIVHCRPELFRAEFAGWLEENWAVWDAFHRQADRIWNSGRRHYSARTIIEWLRHETMVAEQNGQWKLNNSFVPDLARLYGCFQPEREGFFERRYQHSAVRAA